MTFNPDNGDMGEAISDNITITFSEAVRNIDNSVLTDSNSGEANGVGSLITLRLNNTNGTNIAFYATINGDKTVITIDPTNNLPHSQPVYVAIGATVEDSAGNPITAANATFTTGGSGDHGGTDTTAPTAPSVSGTTPTNVTTPTWSWSPGGGGNGTYRYKLDNSDLTSGATTTTSTSYTPGSGISEGSHILYVQERDAVGNWSSSGSRTIVIDTTAPTAPTLLLSSETTTKIEGTTTSTVGSVSVNGLETNATWQFSGTSGNTWTGNITGSLYALDTGTYSQVKSGGGRAKQTDQAGNTSAVSTGTSTLSAINCSGISVTLAKIDDNSEVYVNGTVRASKGFSGTSQETAITSYLVTGENKIIFKLTNGSSGYAYTYKVKKDSTYLFDETCGVWNQSGCNSDSYTSGLVVEIETTIQCE